MIYINYSAPIYKPNPEELQSIHGLKISVSPTTLHYIVFTPKKNYEFIRFKDAREFINSYILFEQF